MTQPNSTPEHDAPGAIAALFLLIIFIGYTIAVLCWINPAINKWDEQRQQHKEVSHGK